MANIWGAVLAGGGQALQSWNEYNAASQRDDILKAVMERRQRQQDSIDAILNGEIGTMRGETPEEERAQAMAEFVGQIKAHQPAIAGNQGARGAVSDREAAAMADLQKTSGDFAGREADISARVAAPARMRINQDLRKGRIGTDIREILHKMESDDFLAELRLARARGNPWMDVLGGAMKQAGGMVSGMGGGTSSLGNAGAGSGYSASAQRAGGGNYVYGGPR